MRSPGDFRNDDACSTSISRAVSGELTIITHLWRNLIRVTGAVIAADRIRGRRVRASLNRCT